MGFDLFYILSVLSLLAASGIRFGYLPLGGPFAASPMNDNILYHALARPRAPRPDPPLSPRKQRVFRIGPEPSRARSGEANP